MKTDYTNLKALSDKKLRTLRNNINNRLEAFAKGGEKKLPPSHMLHDLDDTKCRDILKKVFEEMKKRSKA